MLHQLRTQIIKVSFEANFIMSLAYLQLSFACHSDHLLGGNQKLVCVELGFVQEERVDQCLISVKKSSEGRLCKGTGC